MSVCPKQASDGRIRCVKIFAQSLLRMCTVGVYVLFAVSCARHVPAIDPIKYSQDIEQWRAQRVTELTSDSGWLSLVGLFWLKDGANTVGSDANSDIAVAKVPPHAGQFVLSNGVVTFETSVKNNFTVDGAPVTSLQLTSDADSKPTIVRNGSLSFQIIKRGEKLGVRVKDKESPDRLKFRGLEYFPASLQWRIDARFEPYNPPKPVPILNVLNMESDEPSPGAIVFEIDGKTYRLDAITEKDEPRFFMIFADDTRGKETYGAGRYLYVEPPDKNNHVVIDFNKAYSPPCAFTNFATCPLPPKQNVLPMRIEAGEKYTDHGH